MQARSPSRKRDISVRIRLVPTDDTKASSRCKSMRPLPTSGGVDIVGTDFLEVQLSSFFAACALWMSLQVAVRDSTRDTPIQMSFQ